MEGVLLGCAVEGGGMSGGGDMGGRWYICLLNRRDDEFRQLKNSADLHASLSGLCTISAPLCFQPTLRHIIEAPKSSGVMKLHAHL